MYSLTIKHGKGKSVEIRETKLLLRLKTRDPQPTHRFPFEKCGDFGVSPILGQTMCKRVFHMSMSTCLLIHMCYILLSHTSWTKRSLIYIYIPIWVDIYIRISIYIYINMFKQVYYGIYITYPYIFAHIYTSSMR